MRVLLSAILLLLALSGFLGYRLLYAAIERDGLEQSIKSDQQSIRDLLSYIADNTDCSITAQELADSMSRGRPERVEVFLDEGFEEVASAAFRARFKDNRPFSVAIKDVQVVRVCELR